MLYAIGDEGADVESQFDQFSTFPNIVQMTFDELLSTECVIDNDAGLVLFFPYKLWSAFEETESGLYGGKGFRAKIVKLKNRLHQKLEQAFPEALYVNTPDVFALERDKLATKNFLRRRGISVVPDLPREMSFIKNELAEGNCIYVKVRYGSMGKGITRLEQGKWLTNFRHEKDGEPGNHGDDFEWKTIDVTDNFSFLEKLLIEDVLVEKAVETPAELGAKFDIRGVFVYGRLAELYGRTSTNPLISNLSQGGGCLEFNDLVKMVGIEKMAESAQQMHDANQVFGANLLGVDLTFDRDLKPYVMEVNSFPGLGHGIEEEEIRDALLRDVHSKLTEHHARRSATVLGRRGSTAPVGNALLPLLQRAAAEEVGL